MSAPCNGLALSLVVVCFLLLGCTAWLVPFTHPKAELYDVRTMYAKAVAVREALEARTTRAEAEKAAAETSWQAAKVQVCRMCPMP